MHRTKTLIGLALLLAGSAPALAQEKTRVVTTLPYLADVARRVGGDLVEVEALAPPGMDPHFIIPTPAHSVTLGRAEVFIENGITLELWSERVIDGARNQQIRPGFPGHVYAGQGIRPLQVPKNPTRASGDVHLAGNPHVWLDPLNLKHVARNVEATLRTVRPEGAATFEANRIAFEERIDEAFYGPELVRMLGSATLDRLVQTGRLRAFLAERKYRGAPLSEKAGGWLRRAIELEGLKLISYHQVWTYFAAAFSLPVVATIEEKPGIPPSPSHLEQLEQIARAEGVRVVVCAPYYPLSRAEGVAERIGGVAVVLPTQPGEAEGTGDVFALFDAIFTRLEQAARATSGRPGGE